MDRGQYIIVVVVQIVVNLLLIGGLYYAFNRSKQVFIEQAKQISSGQLTLRAKDNWATRGIADEFNKIVIQMKKLVCEVAEIAQKNTDIASNLSMGIDQNEQASSSVAITISHIAEMACEQSGAASNAKDTTLSMSKNAGEISDYAKETQTIAMDMKTSVAENSEVIKKVIEKMKKTADTSLNLSNDVQELEEEASKINQIVAAVTEISEKTNMLALNAAIEAARAGETGRGFAVVADEVRKLAEQSANSATEIRALIEQIIKRIEKISGEAREEVEVIAEDIKYADAASRSFGELITSTSVTYDAVVKIIELAKESSKLADHVDAMMEKINESIQDTAAGAEEVSASAEEQSASMQEMSNQSSQMSQTAGQVDQYLKSFISKIQLGQNERKMISDGFQQLKEIAKEINDGNISLHSASATLKSKANQHKQFEYIGILNGSGLMVSSNFAVSGKDNYSHRPYFKEAIAGKDYASEPYISNVSFNYCIAISVPFKDNSGKVQGVLMADLCIEK